MRKTKIVCTLGPATEDEYILRELMLRGMNVARINFSHGTYQKHEETMNLVKKMREELNLPVAILLDTKGPEIRLGEFKEKEVELKKNQTFVLTTEPIVGDITRVSISYKELIQDVTEGMTILLDDGLIELKVVSKKDKEIICRVENGGIISSHKGVNVPGAQLSMPFVSKQDYSDIVFGIKQGVDFIAASFTRTAEDVIQIRKILSEYNCNNINIIAKIENRQGIENIDEIIRVSDGIMVARGDLGVEIPIEEIPVIQKKIINKVYNAEKPVITATQMLDSMMKNPRPTRAEVTDVANAIYDGTSAIMLSGETAAGKYPIEVLSTMIKITERAEKDIDYRQRFKSRVTLTNPDVTNAISHATCTTAHDINAAAIITVTKSGKTARMIAKYKPDCPIIGCSTYDYVCRQLSLSWGVIPLLIQEEKNTDELFEHATETVEKAGYVKPGELAVLTAGVPLGIAGTTNLIKVQVVGHILLKGRGIINKVVCASLCVCKEEEDVKKYFKPGDILVISKTSNAIIEELKQAAGLIVEEDGMNSHAAIVSLSLDIPILLGANSATEILKSGAIVTLDGGKGLVSSK